MTVRDDLMAAYALIQDEARWCRCRSAKGRSGREVDPEGRAAVQWCPYGALAKVGARSGAITAANDVARELFRMGSIIEVNDLYGHRAALMVLRHAMLREEGLA